MLLTRKQAEELLVEAEKCNPGPWGDHSRVAAHCAERIARACGDMDPDKAYILGLLHDIGRKFGGRHLGHVSDGYSYMLSLGYEEASLIFLTHSFHDKTTDGYIGNFDTTEEELRMIREALQTAVTDEYDMLIRLCDSLAGSRGVLDMEERMEDVKRRYGSYPRDKWEDNLALKSYFEKKMNRDIYNVTEKEQWTVFRIRKAGLQNADTVAELAVQMWDSHTLQEMAEDICGTMTKEDACFFLSYAGGLPVGFAQCGLRHDYVEGTESTPVGYLEGIFVREEFRNRGYARALLRECEKWAGERECREFASDCELENTDSPGFHRAMGFREANRIICFVKEL